MAGETFGKLGVLGRYVGSCMASTGCFFDLKPIAEAKVLNLEPEAALALLGASLGGFVCFELEAAAVFEDRDHHLEVEEDWREETDIQRKNQNEGGSDMDVVKQGLVAYSGVGG